MFIDPWAASSRSPTKRFAADTQPRALGTSQTCPLVTGVGMSP